MRDMSLPRLASLSIALTLAAAPAAVAADSVRAFVGARLWDGSGGAPVEGAVLLVQDGRVVAAGAGVAIPKDAERIDLAGRFVIPGLVNAHGHVGETRGLRSGPELYSRENVLDHLALYARYGVTTVVSLGGDQAAGFRVRDEQDTPALARARLVVAGRVVDATTPAAAREQVAALAARKADWVKIRVDDTLGTTTRMSPEVWRAVIDEAHRRRLRVAAHIFYLEDARALVDAGVDYVAHSVRDREVPADFTAALKAKGIPYCPTLMREVSTFAYADEPAFFGDPFFLKAADPAVVTELRSPARRDAVRSSPASARYREALAAGSRNLKTLADAGVVVVMGTDSGPPGRFQGYFEHEEMRLMVEAGLTPAQVLFAATGGAARALGLQGVGTLEPGAWADFMVLAADPLADILNTRRIESVYVAGNRVPARP
jgi:imidazolonepropionase-like amidohydrolase